MSISPSIAVVICILIGAVSPSIVRAGVVPIRIDVTVQPPAWPVPCTVGVPFPKDALQTTDPVNLLDADGRAVEFQSRVTATWDTTAKTGVRWLLLDFQPRDARPHRLVFGKDLDAAPAPASNPIITDTDNAFEIDTGILKTVCPKNQLDPWTGLTVEGRKWLDTSKPVGPLVTHETRGTFMAINDRAAEVVLEENGPQRATLKATGWYANDAGEKFGRFIVRLHFHKGLPDVRMEHTFIFTGQSLHDRVRDLAIAMPVVMNQQVRGGALAGEDFGHICDMIDFSDKAHFSITSDRANGRTLDWRLRNVAAEKNSPIKGEKNAGWLGLTTDAATGVAIVLEKAWQQSPFELEVEQNTLWMHLWPRHGRLMDLSFDGMWYYLSEEEKLEKLAAKPIEAPSTVQDTLKWVRSVNRSGMSKTHDLWLLFRALDIYSMRDYVRSVKEPVLAIIDPVWACGTEALMQAAHPHDPTNFRDEEAFLATILDLRLAEREQGKIYGFFDFGGYHTVPFGDGDRNLDAGTWRRARPKSHYGWATYAPAMYYRTGDRRYLDYAKEYSTYSVDAGICLHDNPVTKDFAGGEFGYNNSEIHWLGGAEAFALQSREDAVYLYWLTGQRRMLDALLLWAEQAEQYEATHAADGGGFFLSLEREGPYGNIRRNLGSVLQRWCILYAATGDPRWKARADRVAESFRKIDFSRDSDQEVQNYLQFHASWVMEGLDFYYRLTGDAKIREVMEAFCRQAMRRGLGFSTGGRESASLNFYSFGYQLTGDTAFLRAGQNVVDNMLFDWASPEVLNPGGKWGVQTLPRFLGTVMKAPPEFLRRITPTHERHRIVQWPADHHACFLQEKDGPISIHVASLPGGTYALFDPDGEPCARIELAYSTSLSGKLEAAADSKTGVYTLMNLTPAAGMHYVIDHTMDKVVYELPRENTYWTPRGRGFVVAQRADKEASLFVRPAWGDIVSRRPHRLVELGGKGHVFECAERLTTSVGFNLALPPRSTDTLWQFDLGMPQGMISTRINARGQEMIVPKGLGPYFAATPDNYFEPTWSGGKRPPFGQTPAR